MLMYLILACAFSAINAATECGQPEIPPVEMSTFIVGGQPAEPNSWPWMTEVIKNNGHYCGATLIDNQWVVSAAHCFESSPNLNNYQFSTGGHQSADTGESTRQTFRAQKIIRHEGYSALSSSNDIALIKLDGQVTYDTYSSPACLAESRPSDGTMAYVTGWGALRSGGISPNQLYQVNVPIVSDDACKSAYGSRKIDDSMICAGYIAGGKDSCQGDSGGPMVVKTQTGFNSYEWTLVGVVSWGYGCADAGYYGVYSDVSYLNQWVKDTMASNKTFTDQLIIMLWYLILACAFSAINAATECGQPAIPPVEMSTYIVGGQPAEPNSWPWMTEVIKNNGHYCGATLIDNQWVVSAAHCFEKNPDFSDYEFSVGGHEKADTGEATRQTFRAQKIIRHEGYKGNGNSNDIALIKLDGLVQYNDYASPACLATSRPSNGVDAYVTGWGALRSGGISPNQLYQVNVPIVSQEACEAAYGSRSIDETMICAGLKEGGKDSCQGDSGGPMVVKNQSGWTLVGVVSWGYGCAAEDYYGVYSDVSYLNPWIQDTMASN
ncbi:transmembrane protease serine 9 [Strongylocentrotus purpuratus]|uniref:Peptidase S1 domain-containing protein n=1 Tax=Strongylocentrotus purpuratus TaxID=7668 RepID=A0A7M7P3U8_STRPU|nr:transmembrane protease serine 9 [Strongylocentrotus purpuratus]